MSRSLSRSQTLAALHALVSLPALLAACGGDDASSDTERRSAEDAVSGTFGDDDGDGLDHDGDDEAEDSDDSNDPDNSNDSDPNDSDNWNDDLVDDDTPPPPPSYEDLLADALTQTQVFRCSLNGLVFWFEMYSDGSALAYDTDWQDPGSWTRSGESLTLTFDGYTTTNDPSETYVLGGHILTLPAGELSCNMSHALEQDVMDGSFAHCDYDGFQETWLDFYVDGRVREYTETNIQVDVLMDTYWGAAFFVDDLLALWLPGNDADERLRFARPYADGLAILDVDGNEARWCPFE